MSFSTVYSRKYSEIEENVIPFALFNQPRIPHAAMPLDTALKNLCQEQPLLRGLLLAKTTEERNRRLSLAVESDSPDLPYALLALALQDTALATPVAAALARCPPAAAAAATISLLDYARAHARTPAGAGPAFLALAQALDNADLLHAALWMLPPSPPPPGTPPATALGLAAGVAGTGVGARAGSGRPAKESGRQLLARFGVEGAGYVSNVVESAVDFSDVAPPPSSFEVSKNLIAPWYLLIIEHYAGLSQFERSISMRSVPTPGGLLPRPSPLRQLASSGGLGNINSIPFHMHNLLVEFVDILYTSEPSAVLFCLVSYKVFNLVNETAWMINFADSYDKTVGNILRTALQASNPPLSLKLTNLTFS